MVLCFLLCILRSFFFFFFFFLLLGISTCISGFRCPCGVLCAWVGYREKVEGGLLSQSRDAVMYTETTNVNQNKNTLIDYFQALSPSHPTPSNHVFVFMWSTLACVCVCILSLSGDSQTREEEMQH